MKLFFTRVLVLLGLLAPTCLKADFLFITNNGAITITGYVPYGAFLDVVIPDTINGLPVRRIETNAFMYDYAIQSVAIPNGVTNIGERAFYGCYYLGALLVDSNNPAFSSAGGVLFSKDQTTLIQFPSQHYTTYTISSNVTKIEKFAFAFCVSLSTLNVEPSNPFFSSFDGVLFDKNQTALIQCPYSHFGSTTYTVPDGVLSIEDGAFNGCAFQQVIMPHGVTNIGTYAFSQCYSLQSVSMPDTVRNIQDWAFSECSAFGDFSIPEAVTNIGSYAFIDSQGPTNLILSSNVKTIGAGALAIGRLTAIVVDTNNTSLTSVDGVLFDKAIGSLLEFPAGKPDWSYTVPSGVTNIANAAFIGSRNLSNVTIFAGVRQIGELAFGGCLNLTNIAIAEDNTNYCSVDGALLDKPKRTFLQYPPGRTNSSYVIPDGVRRIGAWSLSGIPASSITVPLSVVQVDKEAFGYNYGRLKGVYFAGNAPGFTPDAFDGDAAVVYYLPGTIGWESFTLQPTAPWYRPNPSILGTAPNFGVQSNHFGFVISWATNASVVVDASPTLTNPNWSPISTNALTNGWSYFSDPETASYPARFYRLRSQ